MAQDGKYVLLVWDSARRRAWFVGERGSYVDAESDSALYNADPIQAGQTFAVHVSGTDNHVTWSTDWLRVMDLAYCSSQATVRDLGPDTYGAIDICLPEYLVSLEASRQES